MTLITHNQTLTMLLHQWRSPLGQDFDRYRNHAYRTFNLCLVCAQQNNITLSANDLDMIAISTAFHDIDIWLDNSFDYIKPSMRRANNYLVREGKSDWIETVTAMITEHHKVTSYSPVANNLIEIFRQAYWIDVSMGLRRFDVARGHICDIKSAFPYHGFHQRLIQLTLIFANMCL